MNTFTNDVSSFLNAAMIAKNNDDTTLLPAPAHMQPLFAWKREGADPNHHQWNASSFTPTKLVGCKDNDLAWKHAAATIPRKNRAIRCKNKRIPRRLEIVNILDITFLSIGLAGARVTSVVHEDDAVSSLNSEADVEDDEVLPEATIQVLDEFFDGMDNDDFESSDNDSSLSSISEGDAFSVLTSGTAWLRFNAEKHYSSHLRTTYILHKCIHKITNATKVF